MGKREAKGNQRKLTCDFLQFGGGAHVCIGRNLALLEINKVCPRLLRDYRLQIMHPGRPLEAKATFFNVQEGLEVYLERKTA